jgi:hypothetical protein
LETGASKSPTDSFDAAAWLSDADESPHPPGADRLWSENWLTYVWCPEESIGIYFHVCRRPGSTGVYEETFNVYLPGDRFLTSRGFAPIRDDTGPEVAGVSFRCDEPFKRWTKCFRGAARQVSAAELWAGPLQDGPATDVDFEMTIETMSPPFDYGAEKLEQAWGTGHYEQHHEMTGRLRYDGRDIELRGAGLRDHSWGPRDWSGIGETTWFHGQFPTSGRSFMVISVPGRPPYERFLYAVVSDREKVYRAQITQVPSSHEVCEAGGRYVLALTTSTGPSVIRAEVMQSMPMTFLAPAEIGHGIHTGPAATHDFVENMTRFEWDGEIGHGMVTGCRPRAGFEG